MIRPESLRERLRKNLIARHQRQRILIPPIQTCALTIEVVAHALDMTPDEVSRRIERSPMELPARYPDPRQMVLFA